MKSTNLFSSTVLAVLLAQPAAAWADTYKALIGNISHKPWTIKLVSGPDDTVGSILILSYLDKKLLKDLGTGNHAFQLQPGTNYLIDYTDAPSTWIPGKKSRCHTAAFVLIDSQQTQVKIHSQRSVAPESNVFLNPELLNDKDDYNNFRFNWTVPGGIFIGADFLKDGSKAD